MTISVEKPGAQTCVQDYPGRVGYWNQGFPPSGPMDSWSFRLANLLVGNQEGTSGLEIQLMGPTLRFDVDSIAAVTGAELDVKLDGQLVEQWTSFHVKAGQKLQIGIAKQGARAYLAVSGGFSAPQLLGSASTFFGAGIGGFDGQALSVGQKLPIGAQRGEPGWTVLEEHRPPISSDRRWAIEVVAGPNDDWIDDAAHERFLSIDWKLSSQSGRTGYRLEGPDWTFTEKAVNKGPEHGSEPSNILDQGYPLGGINLGGQTPIILVNDAPSMGGFICPYTVPSGAFWKLGQSKPGDLYRFTLRTVEQAQDLRRMVDSHCNSSHLREI